MKVFLVGEGPNDIGGFARPLPYKTEEDGFLQPIVRRIIGSDCVLDGQKVTHLPKVRHRRPSDLRKGKLVVAAALAGVHEADILVFHMDADHEFEERRESLERQASSLEVPCALAVSKESIEAWALADEQAVQRVASGAECPKRPEALWGRSDDPKSDHPKSILRRVLGHSASTAEFAEIAEHTRLDHLALRCPRSFPPFRTELERAARLPGGAAPPATNHTRSRRKGADRG